MLGTPKALGQAIEGRRSDETKPAGRMGIWAGNGCRRQV